MYGKELKTVKCAVCGKVFQTYHHNKKYCSYECLNKAGKIREHKKKHLKVCKNCGKFFRRRISTSFCSQTCMNEYKAIKRQAEKCRTCMYSITIASGEPLCNYGEIMGISRTKLGEAKTPCRLHERREQFDKKGMA